MIPVLMRRAHAPSASRETSTISLSTHCSLSRISSTSRPTSISSTPGTGMVTSGIIKWISSDINYTPSYIVQIEAFSEQVYLDAKVSFNLWLNLWLNLFTLNSSSELLWFYILWGQFWTLVHVLDLSLIRYQRKVFQQHHWLPWFRLKQDRGI